jgi:hypothetical protein
MREGRAPVGRGGQTKIMTQFALNATVQVGSTVGFLLVPC